MQEITDLFEHDASFAGCIHSRLRTAYRLCKSVNNRCNFDCFALFLSYYLSYFYLYIFILFVGIMYNKADVFMIF